MRVTVSRPKPKIIVDLVDKKTYKSNQILESDGIYAVFYKGAPFNLKSENLASSYPGPKYKKVSFSNPGHAHNLAKRLNTMFNCKDFQVYKLTSGEIIEK